MLGPNLEASNYDMWSDWMVDAFLQYVDARSLNNARGCRDDTWNLIVT